jgi:predicted N-acetyltransferase YhbS
MELEIREENQNDYRETEVLTREAFWDLYKPGCDEHLIVHKMRSIARFIKELDLVACENNRIVGNVMYSEARVINEEETEYVVLSLGPISVLPSEQKKGIGSRLINESLTIAKNMGYKGILLYGNPKYYSRFGFRNAAQYNITTSTGENFDEFMALELSKGNLDGIYGKYYYDKVFETNKEELHEFDCLFPYKQKHKLSTQIFPE